MDFAVACHIKAEDAAPVGHKTRRFHVQAGDISLRAARHCRLTTHRAMSDLPAGALILRGGPHAYAAAAGQTEASRENACTALLGA
jgi:hypothetical protein